MLIYHHEGKLKYISLQDRIYKMPQTKEELAAKKRAYDQTPARKKGNRISKWKHYGIICADWDALDARFMDTSHCERCSVLLTSGGRNTRTSKCVDHDHSIDDRENVRGILCHACNSNDNARNTSGVPNVSYHKKGDGWTYQKVVNRVRHTKYFKTFEEAVCYKYEYESASVS